jgi:carbonic anhydrase
VRGRTLVVEYTESLGFELDFQGIRREMTRFPADYQAPSGALLLGVVDGTPAGCVGVRCFEDGVFEMKRLYVPRAFRRQGFGRALAEAAIERARNLGYRSMKLDTVPSMQVATSLYRTLGSASSRPTASTRSRVRSSWS